MKDRVCSDNSVTSMGWRERATVPANEVFWHGANDETAAIEGANVAWPAAAPQARGHPQMA
jgi:hypothetical protein